MRGHLEGIEGRFDQNTLNVCMKLYACIHFKTLKSLFLSVLLHHTVLSDMRFIHFHGSGYQTPVPVYAGKGHQYEAAP